MAGEPLLLAHEVAALLRVHPKHVYRLLRRGLPGKRAGGKWLFARTEVLAWAEANGGAAPAPERPRVAGPPPLLAANGDLAVELLLGRSGAVVGFVQADRTSALALLDEGRVLAAGSHGPERGLAEGLVWVHLVEREVGLVARSKRRLALTELPRLRLASRPGTAGVRAYLDEQLRLAGLSSARLHRRALICGSHREVVCAVAAGRADIGLASRAWAARLGLAFAPVVTEPYGLLIRASELGRPEVARLCEAAQSRAYREGLGDFAGYCADRAGDIRFATGTAEAP
jgi:excisionase family DNA binding protein